MRFDIVVVLVFVIVFVWCREMIVQLASWSSRLVEPADYSVSRQINKTKKIWPAKWPFITWLWPLFSYTHLIGILANWSEGVFCLRHRSAGDLICCDGADCGCCSDSAASACLVGATKLSATSNTKTMIKSMLIMLKFKQFFSIFFLLSVSFVVVILSLICVCVCVQVFIFQLQVSSG